MVTSYFGHPIGGNRSADNPRRDSSCSPPQKVARHALATSAPESVDAIIDTELRHSEAGRGPAPAARRPPVQWISTDFLDLRAHVETGRYEEVRVLRSSGGHLLDICNTRDAHNRMGDTLQKSVPNNWHAKT